MHKMMNSQNDESEDEKIVKKIKETINSKSRFLDWSLSDKDEKQHKSEFKSLDLNDAEQAKVYLEKKDKIINFIQKITLLIKKKFF